MEKINQELELKIKSLVKQNKIIEAMTLVKQELQLGLKDSKNIVDQYRDEA